MKTLTIENGQLKEAGVQGKSLYCPYAKHPCEISCTAYEIEGKIARCAARGCTLGMFEIKTRKGNTK